MDLSFDERQEAYPVTGPAPLALACPPRVTVLLATLNGARFLDAQLDSIAAQSHRRWRVLASDDGSQDDTVEILRRHRRRGMPVTIYEGPGEGAAANFLSLLKRLDRNAPGWVSFCDQDDVWLPEKMERGLAALEALDAEDPARPLIYCSRSWITDADLGARRLSPDRPRPSGFRNALIENIPTGHSTLLNPAAARLLVRAAPEADGVISHDWWAYQMVTGAGGRVVFDPTPGLLYRQHGDNLIGAQEGTMTGFSRAAKALGGRFRDWTDGNVAALMHSAHRLTPENRALLEEFTAARQAGPLTRARAMRRLGLYRQSSTATAAFWALMTLGRV